MAEPSQDTDQSMEDILQSIKRIIADEDEPAVASAGSDVLELTDLVTEDVAPPEIAAEPPADIMSIDEIMAASAAETTEIEAAPAIKSPSAAPPEDALMSEATVAASVAALHSLAHAPAHVSYGSPAFRSGTTVEDLVIEALRPMLREWLDGNLPALVRTLVEKEIRRLSA